MEVMAEGLAAERPLADVLEELVRRGFVAHLGAAGGRVRVLGTGRTLAPEDLVIVEHRRFEGASDPDEMAVVYAVEAVDGTRGTLVDAFGVYADPAVGAVVERARRRGRTPA